MRYVRRRVIVTGGADNPHEITVRELAERIIAPTGSRSRIVHCPLPQNDPMQRCPDISLARRTLDWEPMVPLEEGLRRTILYFDDLLAGPAASEPKIPAEVGL